MKKYHFSSFSIYFSYCIPIGISILLSILKTISCRLVFSLLSGMTADGDYHHHLSLSFKWTVRDERPSYIGSGRGRRRRRRRRRRRWWDGRPRHGAIKTSGRRRRRQPPTDRERKTLSGDAATVTSDRPACTSDQ